MSSRLSRSRWLGPSATLPAHRIASLVPSLTEAVFELGAGGLLVARTEWCVSPADGVAGVEAVGGTKNPDVTRLVDLLPDVVLANREENTRQRIEAIASRMPVWLTDPHGPADVPGLWQELGAITGRTATARRNAADVASELAAAERERREEPHPGFVYWVWKDPWMAAGHDTYISRLLETAGLVNALPSEARRFPRITPAEIGGAIGHLLSTEPFAFELPRDLEALSGGEEIGCGRYRLGSGSVALSVDGQLFSWYPARTAAALRAAGALRHELGGLLRGAARS